MNHFIFAFVSIIFGIHFAVAEDQLSPFEKKIAETACKISSNGPQIDKTYAPIGQLVTNQCKKIVSEDSETKDIAEAFFKSCSDSSFGKATLSENQNDNCRKLPRQQRNRIAQKLADCVWLPKNLTDLYGSQSSDLHYFIVPDLSVGSRGKFVKFELPCEPGVYDCNQQNLIFLDNPG
jgi:hypothetical protein